MKLVFATNNKHKFREINEITGNSIELIGLSELGFHEEIPEDFHSLEENATQKACYIYKKFGMNCFADDTGLEIKALNNEPGVYSARYAGINCTFEDNIQKVLERMKEEKNRQACFRTVIALVDDGKTLLFKGEIKGSITHERKGEGGFGYDSIFRPEGYKVTFAEMLLSEKNRISHRTMAIQKLFSYLLEKSEKQ